MPSDESVPQPGPAQISQGGGPDEWLEAAKQCKYLPEQDIKRLCEIVKEYLMEGQSSGLTNGSVGLTFLQSRIFSQCRRPQQYAETSMVNSMIY